MPALIGLRHEPAQPSGGQFHAQRINRWIANLIAPQAPIGPTDPVRPSEEYLEGKPYGHAASFRQLAYTLDFSTLSIFQYAPYLVRLHRAQWVAPTYGAMLPWQESTNIGRPPAVTISSLYELQGAPSVG